MKWRRGVFREQRVWVGVDDDGRPKVVEGRIPIRYRPDPQAKVYRAGVAQVVVDPDAAVEEIASITRPKVERKDTIVAFCDGATKGNPGPSGAGALVRVGDEQTVEIGRHIGQGTNNIAELTAIGVVLEVLERLEIRPDQPVTIFTDSKYSIGVLSQNWKAKANRELILTLKKELAKWPNVRFSWVAGHSGIAGNERADELASDAALGDEVDTWAELDEAGDET